MSDLRKTNRWMKGGQLLSVVIALCAYAGGAGAQEPEILVEVDRQKVYLGESIIYNVTVNHVENPSAPQLSGFDSFSVETVGQQSLDSHQISIINGRRSEIIRRGRLYQYRLTPLSAGQQTIPSPTATIDGNTIRGREVPIAVVAPEKQDVVLLEVASDRETGRDCETVST